MARQRYKLICSRDNDPKKPTIQFEQVHITGQRQPKEIVSGATLPR